MVFQTRRVRFDLPPPDGGNSTPTQSSQNSHSSSTSRSRGQTSAQTIATVRVTSCETPARQRVQTGHSVGRYVKGTLSPTSAQASCGAAAITPALLRASRDGDDHQIKEALRRAVLIGINEKELNAQDSSGRVSTPIYLINIFKTFLLLDIKNNDLF